MGQNSHWAGIAEIGSAWGLNFLYGLYKVFGRWPLRLALLPVTLYFFAAHPGPRRASREFLARAGGPPGLWGALRHFFSFADSSVDKLIAWNGGIRFEDVDFIGREAVEVVLKSGKGFLLLGSHQGNLEICRVLSRLRPGLKLHVLVHTRHAENFNRMLRRLNPESSVNLIQVSQIGVAEAAWLAGRVDAGEVILIAADRVPLSGGRSSRVPFLGAEAAFPQGPFILASLLGCPVFLLFCLRQGKRFEASFEAFADKVEIPRPSREKALGDLAARFASRLEHYCRKAPLQWFNFYPFWGTHEL
jgi:predicted LPLAT superfamily acyltransferase